MIIEIEPRQTVVIAILVLFLGKFLTGKLNFLREYNIPEPVSGGLIASMLSGVIYLLADIQIQFSLELRDTLLIVFFTTIGLSSKFSTLVQGGKSLLVLLVLAVIYLCIQNITGLSVISLTSLPSEVGLIGGSVSLSGGHGTAIAWAPVFINEYGVTNAMELGIACATFGLILGGVIGGPIARFLIRRNNLSSNPDTELTVGIAHESADNLIDYHKVLNEVLMICISIGFGITVNDIFELFGLKLPDFVSCLFAGILLINIGPLVLRKISWPEKSNSLALISDLSLGLFLSMSLMSLQLWTLAGMGVAILLLLIAQVVIVSLLVIFILFRLMGKDYDAAVIASGFAGMALGATPTAIANMTAVTERFGASSKAFVVVPLVGAFFIDMANALIIQFFIDVI